jgi:hypothetical protein
MKFEDWKNESDLALVCKKLLDNADMDYSFGNCPLSIDFVFYVVGSDIKVLFSCSEISKLYIEKEHDDVPIHLVLEVNVRKENETFYIQIMPEFNLELECKSFSWSIKEFSEEEVLEVYPNA